MSVFMAVSNLRDIFFKEMSTVCWLSSLLYYRLKIFDSVCPNVVIGNVCIGKSEFVR